MYEIKLSNETITAEMEGWISASEVDDVFNEIKDIVKEETCTRIMIDIKQVTILPDPTAEAMITHLKNLKSKFKLAFIWRDDIFFCSKFEKILEQLSRSNILGFNNVSDARNWLLNLELPVLLGSSCSGQDTTTTTATESNLE